MSRRSMLTRWTATVTIVALQMFFVVSADSAPASLHGQLIGHDGESPLADARVHLGEIRGDRFFNSGWTDEEGRFRLSDVPPATYRVAVEADGGLYLVDAPLVLAAGQDRSLQLAVHRTETAEADATGGTAATTKPKGWNNPLTATAIVLGAAVGAGLLIDAIDDDDGTQSPSAP